MRWIAACILIAAPVQAQDAVSRGISAFAAGIVCEPIVIGQTPAPDTIAGTTNIVEEIPTFVSTSRVVPAVLGIGFGVISQAKPTDVPVTMVITHPPMGDGGVTRESYDAIISAGADSLTMFTFEYEYELVAGPWAITAMTGEDVLFRAEFTVAPPQQVPALAGICGYENLLS